MKNLEAKSERLLRMHRRFAAFDDYHMRAVRRLKRTVTAKKVFAARAEHADYLRSERLLRTWS